MTPHPSGSVWAILGGPMVRFEGRLPQALHGRLEALGCVRREGGVWCRADAWPAVQAALDAAGVVVGTGPKDEHQRRAEVLVTGPNDEVIVEGDLPDDVPPDWLGHVRVRSYRGLTPYVLPGVTDALAGAGIEASLSPSAQVLKDRILNRRAAVEAALTGPLPDVPLKTATLRDYQRRAVAFSDATGGRFILADQPGLGKTHVAIAVKRRLDAGRTVVVCPNIAKFQWAGHIEAQDGGPCHVMEGRTGPPIPKGTEWVVLNVELLHPRIDQLLAWNPDLFVPDEAHFSMRGTETKRGAAMLRLAHKAPHVIPMTGTPILGYPVDLWPLLDAVEPGWWGSQWSFGCSFSAGKKTHFGWEFKGATRTEVLSERLRFVMLRRLKSEVLTELPPKTRTLIPVDLDPNVWREYDRVWAKMAALFQQVRELETRADRDPAAAKKIRVLRGQRLALVGELRQVSSLGRVPSTVEAVADLARSGRPVVVFAYYRESLSALEVGLAQAGLRVGVVHGGVSARDKADVVRRFQAGDLDVFLGQIESAKEAIDLYRSDVTVTHDVVWVGAHLEQAESRCHRSGQTAARTEHLYMVGRRTIDEQVVRVAMTKLAAAGAVLDSGATFDEDAVAEIEREFWAGGGA